MLQIIAYISKPFPLVRPEGTLAVTKGHVLAAFRRNLQKILEMNKNRKFILTYYKAKF